MRRSCGAQPACKLARAQLRGITALIGVREIGLVKATDRILVSGAAGGVGSHVAEIAKALGAQSVVGIAGGPEKCRRLTTEMGYDKVIDYKHDNVDEALDDALPEGIDLYFDNVGGEILEAAQRRA